MDKETEYIENIQRKQPSIRIMSTPLYRQYLQEGLDCSGFNLYMAGKWGYECTRLSYNAKLMSKDQDDWNLDNVVRVGHPLPGFYKIVDLLSMD